MKYITVSDLHISVKSDKIYVRNTIFDTYGDNLSGKW